MQTDYEKLLPKNVIFNLKQIQDLGIVKTDMMKKLIYKKEIEVVKIGNKLHISRMEILRYLYKNTIPASNMIV